MVITDTFQTIFNQLNDFVALTRCDKLTDLFFYVPMIVLITNTFGNIFNKSWT